MREISDNFSTSFYDAVSSGVTTTPATPAMQGAAP